MMLNISNLCNKFFIIGFFIYLMQQFPGTDQDSTNPVSQIAWNFIVMLLIIGIIFTLSWFVIFAISKFSSLSSLIASVSIPVYLLVTGQFKDIFFFIIMFVLIFFTHRENIKRLKNKEETKTKIY